MIDRANAEDWLREGKRSIGQRAAERAGTLIASYPGSALEPGVQKELGRIIRRDIKDGFLLPDTVQ